MGRKGQELRIFPSGAHHLVRHGRADKNGQVRSKLRFLALSLAAILTVATSCIRYQARPVEPAKVMDDFEARTLAAPELGELLIRNGEVKDWPPAVWDLKALTLAAFYYHPDLDIARAQWGIARGGIVTAGERPNPTLNIITGYNSTTPVSLVTPWIPEVSLDIPIETVGKRGIRIAQARKLAEAARWDIFTTAWEVRSRLRGALLGVYAAGEKETLLIDAQRLQAETVRLLEIEKEAGEVSAYEVEQARVALDNARLAAVEAARVKEAAMASLAAAVGLPRKALEGVRLSFDTLLRPPMPDLPAAEVRRHAVLNRSDILGALSEYAAAEAALRLEIAKQYPDIRLGPDYQLDQTDNKWTLGLSFDLPILSRNRGPIAEATARRAENAARFLALQSQVIGELDAAVEDCRAALRKSRAADDLLAHLTGQAKVAGVRRELGEISRLDLLAIQLELNAGAQARLEALVQAQEAVGRLENAAQSPLDVKDWIITKARPEAGPGKEREDE
jgi:cobalt-zinc-cadmium efflux system outer membrane protein